MTVYNFKFPAPIKIPRLHEKFPKSQVDSQNPKIWRKIPSSGGLGQEGPSRLNDNYSIRFEMKKKHYLHNTMEKATKMVCWWQSIV